MFSQLPSTSVSSPVVSTYTSERHTVSLNTLPRASLPPCTALSRLCPSLTQCDARSIGRVTVRGRDHILRASLHQRVQSRCVHLHARKKHCESSHVLVQIWVLIKMIHFIKIAFVNRNARSVQTWSRNQRVIAEATLTI